MSASPASSLGPAPRFHAGGSLPAGALYVERPADGELCTALLRREFCYVLAPRQIGKSSLRVRAARWLKERDILCATIDLTRIGGTCSDPEQWYYGLVEEVARKLKLLHPRAFWLRQLGTTPVHRFVLYLREQVLRELTRPVVIFIDEIDSLLALPFSTDDFFAAVRDAYNARAEDEAYERLTFCLMGVATPAELIKNPARTPFNIGKGIRLLDFTAQEARALLPGLVGAGHDPELLLDEVLSWTSGHPYMTQRICEALLRPGQHQHLRSRPRPNEAKVTEPKTDDADDAGPWQDSPAERVGRLVGEIFLRRGRNEEPNLTYAESRLQQSPHMQDLLRLYRRLLDGERPGASSDDPVQLLLRLTGMAAEERGPGDPVLRVRNRIFATVFDRAWVKEKERRGLFTEPLLRWQEANKGDDFLLRGQALHEAIEWARGREDLSPQEHEFLLAGLELARRDEELRRKAAEEERRAALERERRQRLEQEARAQRRNVAALTAVVGVLSGLLLIVAWQYHKLQGAEEAQRAARAAEAAAKDRAQEVSLAERGLRAALLSRQPGDEVVALVTGIRAVGPAMKEQREPLVPALHGLTSASAALLFSLPLRGHGAGVGAVAFAPDSRRVVTASLDRTARIWDVTTGQVLAVLRGHGDGVLSASFSPDGKRVLTTSRDRTARLWDATTGRQLFVLHDHTKSVPAGAFSPDGKRVVTASLDQTARIWDAASGRPLAVLRGQSAGLDLVAFSPDGQRVVVASSAAAVPRDDHVALVFDALGGKPVATLRGHGDGILGVVFSPDGRLIATASRDDTARLWNAGSGQQVAVLRGHAATVCMVAFSPDGQRVVTAGLDGTARMWSAVDGQPLSILRGHSAGVSTAVFSRDGKRVVTASADKTARLWSAATGVLITTMQGHSDAVGLALFSPDDTRVATASDDHSARLWNTGAVWASKVLRGHGDRLYSARFSQDGRRVVTASADRTARIWEVFSGDLLQTLSGHQDRVYSAVFSQDGSRVLTASADHTARLWDTGTGKQLAQLGGHGQSVWSASFSPDETRILTTSRDGTARLWRDSGEPLPVLGGGVQGAVFSPHGDRVATVHKDGTARLWEVESGQQKLSLRGHPGGAFAVAFSPDQARLATGGQDRAVRVWDLRTGKLLLTLEGHGDAILSVIYSPDGTLLATTSADRTARLWDAASGALLSILQGQADEVRPTMLSAVFAPNGKRLLTASLGKTARIWDVATGQRLATLRGHLASLSNDEEAPAETEADLPASYLASSGAAGSFSPTGARVTAILGNDAVWIQPVTAKAFFAIACGLLRYQPELRQQQVPRDFMEAQEYCLPFFGKSP